MTDDYANPNTTRDEVIKSAKVGAGTEEVSRFARLERHEATAMVANKANDLASQMYISSHNSVYSRRLAKDILDLLDVIDAHP